LAQIPDTNHFLNDRRVSRGFSFYGKPYDKHWIEIVECINYPYLEGWYLWNSGIEEYETDVEEYETKFDIDMDKWTETNDELIYSDHTNDYIF